MKTVRVTIDPSDPASMALGRIDAARVDEADEEELARQAAADEAEACRTQRNSRGVSAGVWV